MKAKEYNKLFDDLKMNPRSKAAADLLGLCLRSTYHYADGQREVPEPVAKLLRLIVACHRKGLLRLTGAA